MNDHTYIYEHEVHGSCPFKCWRNPLSEALEGIISFGLSCFKMSHLDLHVIDQELARAEHSFTKSFSLSLQTFVLSAKPFVSAECLWVFRFRSRTEQLCCVV